MRFHGTFAAAQWAAGSGSSFTDTFVSATQAKQGSELSVFQLAGNTDANGNFTGGVQTTADVFSGFSFTIDHARLTTASTSASGVPATACTLDEDFNPISCSATTIDLNASWTGQGPITRGVTNSHFKSGGFSVNTHFNGADRNATAAGTIAGVTFGAGDVEFADLGTTNSGVTTVCRGTSC